MHLARGGATGEEDSLIITELKASSKTSNGLLGLISSGVPKSTEPESTRESRNFEAAGSLRRVGVGVSRLSGSSHASKVAGFCVKKFSPDV